MKPHHEENSAQANIIDAELRELALGCHRIMIAKKSAAQLVGAEISLTIIKNNKKLVSGEDIPAFIKEFK